jgi:hypothetical protein
MSTDTIPTTAWATEATGLRERLWEAGFLEGEAERLLELHTRLGGEAVLEPFTEAERRRLRFARWLVRQGRLSG